MATAEVGDDVWGEDPTVIALEERAAAAVGKEAAVFVPSGTMGNAIGMRLHAGQGDALWAHDASHVIDNEGGGPAALWGILPRGIATAGRLLRRRRAARAWCPRTTPTTTTRSPAWSASRTRRPPPRARRGRSSGWPRSASYAHARGMKVHMDGARLFNAAVALGVGADVICREVDTVQFCLSKGLGAPVGLDHRRHGRGDGRANRYRKLLGGGMRQAGIVAAAASTRSTTTSTASPTTTPTPAGWPRASAPARGSRPTRRRGDQHRPRAPARAPRHRRGVCDELEAVGVLAAPYDRTRSGS